MNLEEAIANAIRRARTADELALALERLIDGGFAVWFDGSLIETRQLVARVRGLRIEIQSREHPPPHFHVRAPGLRVSFAIEDCRLLEGSISGRDRALIEWWYGHSRPLLIEVWNATRPADCPVGPIPS
jgi:hypothetical protein